MMCEFVRMVCNSRVHDKKLLWRELHGLKSLDELGNDHHRINGAGERKIH